MGKKTRFKTVFPNRIFVESLQLFPPTVINIINGENLSIYFLLDISFILPEIKSASALSFDVSRHRLLLTPLPYFHTKLREETEQSAMRTFHRQSGGKIDVKAMRLVLSYSVD